MECRAPLLYYEHAGKFEEDDGELAAEGESLFKPETFTWSMCNAGRRSPLHASCSSALLIECRLC